MYIYKVVILLRLNCTLGYPHISYPLENNFSCVLFIQYFNIFLSFIFKDEAFDIGEEIAEVITKQNPKPMKLKFEKVSCSFFAQLCSYL
jgi:hypothetical protein